MSRLPAARLRVGPFFLLLLLLLAAARPARGDLFSDAVKWLSSLTDELDGTPLQDESEIDKERGVRAVVDGRRPAQWSLRRAHPVQPVAPPAPTPFLMDDNARSSFRDGDRDEDEVSRRLP